MYGIVRRNVPFGLPDRASCTFLFEVHTIRKRRWNELSKTSMDITPCIPRDVSRRSICAFKVCLAAGNDVVVRMPDYVAFLFVQERNQEVVGAIRSSTTIVRQNVVASMPFHVVLARFIVERNLALCANVVSSLPSIPSSCGRRLLLELDQFASSACVDIATSQPSHRTLAIGACRFVGECNATSGLHIDVAYGMPIRVTCSACLLERHCSANYVQRSGLPEHIAFSGGLPCYGTQRSS